MANKYYQKELPDQPCWIKGNPIKFDILETADPILIRELDNCVARGIAGIIPITEEQYQEELKKKAHASESGSSSNRKQGRQELSALHARRVAEAQGRGQTFQFGAQGTFAGPQRDGAGSKLPTSGRPMPEPIEVPSPSSFSGVFLKKPPTARASEIRAAQG